MSSWRNGRGFQWQPVKLWWWWTPCLRELRQCWNIMVATQNIDPLEPIWTFSPRGVLSFVASDSDIINVLSSFEGTANLQCYTSCTLTTLHCIKVSFLQGCPIKRYNKIFAEMWGVYSLLWDTVIIICIVTPLLTAGYAQEWLTLFRHSPWLWLVVLISGAVDSCRSNYSHWVEPQTVDLYTADLYRILLSEHNYNFSKYNIKKLLQTTALSCH